MAIDRSAENPPMLSQAAIRREDADRQERAASKLRMGLNALNRQRGAIDRKHNMASTLEARLIDEWHSAHQSAKRDWVRHETAVQCSSSTPHKCPLFLVSFPPSFLFFLNSLFWVCGGAQRHGHLSRVTACSCRGFK